jgi:DNA-binding GntR family transcriptional regulator
MAHSTIAKSDFAVAPLAHDASFKAKAYEALKGAITKIDIYTSAEPVMLDERALSERLGVSRTPIREALAMLEQDGFVRTVPRRGIVVVRKSKDEIVDMIRAWAALESMAARLIATDAKKPDIAGLRYFFKEFGPRRLPQHHIADYSKANVAFHQALISLSGSKVLIEMTGNILLHVRGHRQMTIGREDRIAKSLPEHLAIIDALEERDAARAEALTRDHTLGLASYVDAYGHELFT